MRKLEVLLISLVFFVCELFPAFSQSHHQLQKQKAVDTVVPDFSITNATIIEGISQLSLQPIAGLHFGVEEVLKEKMSRQDDSRPLRFSIHAQGKTVAQILDLLCGSDARYVWTQDANTINVYPVAIRSDGSYFMNLPLRRITVRDLKSPEAGLTFLHKELPNQQLGYSSGGENSSYLKPWTQEWKNITVRQFINRLGEHMDDHTSWILHGAKNERYFTFEQGGFH